MKMRTLFIVLLSTAITNCLQAGRYDQEYIEEVPTSGKAQSGIDVEQGTTKKSAKKQQTQQRTRPVSQRRVSTPMYRETQPTTRRVVRRRVVREYDDGGSTGRGIIGGAAAGAVVGGLAGGGKGAGIGLGVGALTGGMIGASQDRARGRDVIYEEEYLD
jgi:uncharacterized protein YcfJ